MTTVIDRHAALAPLGAQLVAEVKALAITKKELALTLDVPQSEASMLKTFSTPKSSPKRRKTTSLLGNSASLRAPNGSWPTQTLTAENSD